MDPLEARSLIPLTAHYIHMNHAGVSPMTERSRAAIEQVVDGALNRPYPAGAAFDEADRVRGLAAQLINGSPDGIALTVTDDGPGFPPGFAAHAFERFSRAEQSRSSGGTGLGLAIVAAIASAHGGAAEGSSAADRPASQHPYEVMSG